MSGRGVGRPCQAALTPPTPPGDAAHGADLCTRADMGCRQWGLRELTGLVLGSMFALRTACEHAIPI